MQQGWIPGYPSREQVARGCIRGHSIIWVGAVRPETAKEKSNGPTDRRTDRLTKRGVESHSMELKTARNSVLRWMDQ